MLSRGDKANVQRGSLYLPHCLQSAYHEHYVDGRGSRPELAFLLVSHNAVAWRPHLEVVDACRIEIGRLGLQQGMEPGDPGL